MKSNFSHYREACIVACLFLVFYSCTNSTVKEKKNSSKSDSFSEYLTTHLAASVKALEALEANLNSDSILHFYKQARNHFKSAEPLLSFTDRESYLALNQPNILKVQEEDATDIKISSAFGFQVIEELIQEEKVDQAELNKQIKLTKNRLSFIKSNVDLQLKAYHVLWIIRDQVIRVATLGITGFDSPLGNSLAESSVSYESLINMTELMQKSFTNQDLKARWLSELEKTIEALKTDFDSFNRYAFIKTHTHKQLELLNEIREDWAVDFPLELAFNNNVQSLFTDTTFNLSFFHDYHKENQSSTAKVELGKRLFNDKRLSKANDMSCATCHNKSLAFTDGLVNFPRQKRNTPTLKYAAFQKAFFYDNRAGSLEGQIVSVVNNEKEFHMDLKSFTEKILADTSYKKALPKEYGEQVDDQNVRNAISSYTRSLSPFNSKFDQNMQGKRNDLTAEEIKGFNLFTGKAQCATCHFAPVFNGTVPPYFTTTEMELLGVPDDTVNNMVDDDLGRYEIFKTEERKHFFKTPTVRNISLTAPYMHNGVYESLEQVIEFYNNGGGVGMGMELEHQTLPADSLHLSQEEVKALVAFMKSLEDEESL